MSTLETPEAPVRKAHWINESCMMTIAPEHVKRLGIDKRTFFEQIPTENGILLRMRRLS